MNMIEKRNILFSPPDITDAEIAEVLHAMRSGWITTGPRTKLFERRIAEYIGANRAVCLNSATSAMELTLRILGIGPGDEVITSAYTYTATASVIDHVGAKIVFIDTAPNSYEMDYYKLVDAITERTKVIIPVDIGGVMCNYEKIFAAVENRKNLYKPGSKIQNLFDRPIVMSDAVHSFGAPWCEKESGDIADFTPFSLHEGKFYTGLYAAKQCETARNKAVSHCYHGVSTI